MISKSLFVDTINAIREQIEFDEAYAVGLAELTKTEYVPHYDHSRITKSLLNLLRVWFPKFEGECLIEEYCFYHNFGKYTEDNETSEQFYDRLLTLKQ